MTGNARLAASIIRYTLAAVLLIIGADKVFHAELITDWEAYLGPVATTIFPFAPETIVRIQGSLELLIAALLAFTPFVRIAVSLFILATLAVAADIASFRYYILLPRDAVLIASAVALLLLSPRR